MKRLLGNIKKKCEKIQQYSEKRLPNLIRDANIKQEYHDLGSLAKDVDIILNDFSFYHLAKGTKKTRIFPKR